MILVARPRLAYTGRVTRLPRHCWVVLATLAVAACDAAGSTEAQLALVIDGAATPPPYAIAFPEAVAGEDEREVALTLTSLGPGALELTGNPAIAIEGDDRLAFSVSEPDRRRLAKGESTSVSVRFAPHAVGASTGRLVIATNAADPVVVTLSGNAIDEDVPVLVLTLDGAPLGASFDFGSKALAETATTHLRLANAGTGTLVLGQNINDLANLEGADAASFALTTPSRASLGEGEHLDLELTFTPERCGLHQASLRLTVAGLAPIVVALSGRGGDNPQGHAGLTDASLLDAPDVAIALSGPFPSAATRHRLAIGNLTVGSYAGRVGTYVWDGCTLSRERAITPATAGLAAQLFGAQVDLADDGQTLLVSARDQRKDAWLFGFSTDDEPRFLGTLATLVEAGGHGRGAALAGDGSAAFVGQALATSGFNAHGAVLVYERPAAGWSAQPEAWMRLLPSVPTKTELVGATVDASRSGDVVVSGALQTAAGAPEKGPAEVLVWEAVRTEGVRRWGREIQLGEPDRRTETLRLVSGVVPLDGLARVAVSADGHTIALSTAEANTVSIRLFVRSGPGELWGIATANEAERGPNATLRITASTAAKMSLGPSGEVVFLADLGGVREYLRPTGGWRDDVPRTTLWNVPVFSLLGLSPDASTLVGTDKAGAAWFFLR